MDMQDFDYDLDPELIAQTPCEPRDDARLLDDTVTGGPAHRRIADLPDALRAGDLLVLNETKVIPARLALRKPTGGVAEVLLVERRADGPWIALVRPSKRLPVGTVLVAGPEFAVRIGAVLGEGRRSVELVDPTTERSLDLGEEERGLIKYGVMPLPPYITTGLSDPDRYQTVFARLPGSVAAPTAGLHLTTSTLAALKRRDIATVKVDLKVGLDTFRPITVDDPEQHSMHSERYRVPLASFEACVAAKREGRRVVVVGTTAVRAIESAAAFGNLEGRTSLFIRGSYPFALTDVLLTNFHLPRSSLLLMVESLIGPRWKELYAIARSNGYRFLSFGDAMLVSRTQR